MANTHKYCTASLDAVHAPHSLSAALNKLLLNLFTGLYLHDEESSNIACDEVELSRKLILALKRVLIWESVDSVGPERALGIPARLGLLARLLRRLAAASQRTHIACSFVPFTG